MLNMASLTRALVGLVCFPGNVLSLRFPYILSKMIFVFFSIWRHKYPYLPLFYDRKHELACEIKLKLLALSIKLTYMQFLKQLFFPAPEKQN